MLRSPHIPKMNSAESWGSSRLLGSPQKAEHVLETQYIPLIEESAVETKGHSSPQSTSAPLF